MISKIEKKFGIKKISENSNDNATTYTFSNGTTLTLQKDGRGLLFHENHSYLFFSTVDEVLNLF